MHVFRINRMHLFLKELLYVRYEVVLLDAFSLHHQPVVELAQSLQHTWRRLIRGNMSISTVRSRQTCTQTHK